MASSIEFKNDAKGNLSTIILRDVALFYTCVMKPRPIQPQKDWSNPTRFEYSVGVAVTEEMADEWDEVFAKQSSTKLTNKKFKERYKLEEGDELPVPDAKKQFIINVKQKTHKSNGDKVSPKLRPRVVEAVEGGKPIDVTMKKLVGNGSRGDVLIRVSHSKEFGATAHLNVVKVTQMVDYAMDDGNDEELNDFLGGEVEFEDIDDGTEDAKKESKGSDKPVAGEGEEDFEGDFEEDEGADTDDEDDDDYM